MNAAIYLLLIAGIVAVLALSGANFFSGVPALLFLVNLRRGDPCHLGGVRL